MKFLKSYNDDIDNCIFLMKFLWFHSVITLNINNVLIDPLYTDYFLSWHVYY